jgi:beta-glucuronidase
VFNQNKNKTVSIGAMALIGLSVVVTAYSQNENLNAVAPTDADQTTTQATNAVAAPAAPVEAPKENKSSEELVRRAWEASHKNDIDKIKSLLDEALPIYGEEANKQEASLSSFPIRGQENNYQALNDIGTLYFIYGEALMNAGRKDESIAVFQKNIQDYKWAQNWDPRGWFWSTAEKSQSSIDVMTGNVKEEPEPVSEKKTMPHIALKGTEDVIDYKKYGEFIGVETPDYQFKINDPKGLSDAVGEGIYPNTSGVLKDPNYKKVKDEGRLEGSHWDFVRSDDLEAAFYKWATASEPGGIKLFYLGIILERAKMYTEAIKAYHAIIVHFPKSVGWTYWQTPWYPAQAAVAKIKHIIQTHPELNLEAKWMKVEVVNGFDNDINNDQIIANPGVVHKKTYWDQLLQKMNVQNRPVAKLGGIKKTVGQGKIQLVQYENGHWKMLVDGKPFVLKGITYAPTKVGQSPDKGTLESWMVEDSNNNGKLDGPYETWVDKNGNNKQDPDEPVVGDFKLMKEMGVNALRIYHQPFEPKKEVLRKMYDEYGFHVVMGDFLGKYTLGSGATWFEGTDYENPDHQKNMMDSVRKMVEEYKDEPYILVWVLGNENNYGIASNADKKPEAYYKFVNEVAKMIKSIDPNHPVAACNGDTLYLDVFAKYAPDVDIYAANVYRGDYGFGSFWEQVYGASGKPAFITEYGSPAFAKHLSLPEGEQAQADYHRGNWSDIENNLGGTPEGVGNALGGIIFEWTDEWWKNYEPFYHDKKSDAIGPFPGGYYFEEWFGITGQGDGQNSPFLRQLRKSYYLYKEMWNKEVK